MGGEGVGFWWWWWVGQSNRKVWKKENGVDMGNEWDWERDGGGGVKWEVNGFEGELFFPFSLPREKVFFHVEICYGSLAALFHFCMWIQTFL